MTRAQAFRFETSTLEDHRAEMVDFLIPSEETLPEGTLDNDERCALHWMLSHSLITTLQDDEERDQPQYNKGYLRANRETGKQQSFLSD
ncbi:unnamed protein product, partial [Allacma fusca]